MLKWAVTGGSGGKGSHSTPASGRTTPVTSGHDLHGKHEVNNNNVTSLDPLPYDETDKATGLPPKGRNPFIKGSDPLYQTARGRHQNRRSRLNEQIQRELRLRTGAENLLQATNNRKLRDTVSLELSFVNSNLQLLKEEMSDLNSSVDIYQGNGCATCIPMIPLGLKETKDINFVTPLKGVILEHYHEQPDSYVNALEEIQKIRAACRTPVRSSDGVELLFKYYNSLYFLEKRLFVPNRNMGIQFEWYDSLTGVPSTQRTVGFEKGSILFNIGALLTQIGARQDRSTLEGLEAARENFRQAAGAFRYLREHFTHAPSRDMQAATLDMLVHLLLAQSQECLFEKRQLLSPARPDPAAVIVTAHEAAAVSDLYRDTHTHMCLDANGPHTPGSWTSLVAAKMHYYRALAHYHAATAMLHTQQSPSQQQSPRANPEGLLVERLEALHVWSPGSPTHAAVGGDLETVDDRRTAAKAHLRRSILNNEDALMVHSKSRQLRKIDAFQDILKQAHDRSLQKFTSLEDEDDFSDLKPAPDIKPKSDNAASPLTPDFSQYKVEDPLYNLGPLALFSAQHQWLAPRTVEMSKEAGQEFGFSVRGDSPVVIAAVEPGSRAERCGVRVSDFIAAVGGVDTRWHRHEDTVALIRRAGSRLTLRLVTPLDRNYVAPGAAQTPSQRPRQPSVAPSSGSHSSGAPSSGSSRALGGRRRSGSRDANPRR